MVLTLPNNKGTKMTPLEILKESEKEFDEKFEGIWLDGMRNYESDTDYTRDETIQKLKSHLTSLIIKLLEGEIERLRKLVKTYTKTKDFHFTDTVEVDNYNKAVYESIEFIESQLSEIKQNK